MNIEARFKLNEVLKTLKLNASTVERTAREDLGYKIGVNTIYNLTGEGEKSPKRFDLATLTAVVAAIRHLTGRQIEMSDLIEFVEVPRQAS